MHVLATAGHVDHGKSTLVRALTGMEPDRFAEERRRAMTLDLGFAWTRLGNGHDLAFVDVPGHEKFVQTMLAGVGPAPAVLVVVAADQGWQEQSSEHLAIIDSLGVAHGILVVTRSDLADPAPALGYAQQRLARTSLGTVPAVAVSATTGQGMAQLRDALARLVEQLPEPDTTGRVRLFVDRAFTIRGAGTVVTGTLGGGRLAVGDTLQIAPGRRTARVRGLQRLGEAHDEVSAVARVAINLRGVPVSGASRGSALLTPGAWIQTAAADVRLTDLDPADLPGDLMLHLGSAAVPCRVRPLGEDTCRVALATSLPVSVGDRAVLRDPSRRLVTGVVVLDVEPPPLRRRGAALARARELVERTCRPDPVAEVARRGAVTRDHLAALGALPADASVPAPLREIAGAVVHPDAWDGWKARVLELLDERAAASPLDAGLSPDSVRRELGLPTAALVDALIDELDGAVVRTRGRIARPGAGPVFTDTVRAVLDGYARRLSTNPWDAPTRDELDRDGITGKIIGAAGRAGLFRTLPGDVLVRTDAPELALRILSGLAQPFTMSQARQALGTSRRIAMPLLEYLDEHGLTVRVDDNLRRVAQR
jgi:selenocysteine-specific elongation factor